MISRRAERERMILLKDYVTMSEVGSCKSTSGTAIEQCHLHAENRLYLDFLRRAKARSPSESPAMLAGSGTPCKVIPLKVVEAIV